jgi:hypothetical protein
MGIKPGDELMARVKNGQLLLEELDHALKRVQAMIQDATQGESGVDQLIAERRREAKKEQEEIFGHDQMGRDQAS